MIAAVDVARRLLGSVEKGTIPSKDLSAENILASVAKGTALLSEMFEKDGKILHWRHHTLRLAHDLLATVPFAFQEPPPILWHVGVEHAAALLKGSDYMHPNPHPTKGEILHLRGEHWSHLSVCEPTRDKRQHAHQNSIADFAAALRIFCVACGVDSMRTHHANARLKRERGKTL